MVKGAEFK